MGRMALPSCCYRSCSRLGQGADPATGGVACLLHCNLVIYLWQWWLLLVCTAQSCVCTRLFGVVPHFDACLPAGPGSLLICAAVASSPLQTGFAGTAVLISKWPAAVTLLLLASRHAVAFVDCSHMRCRACACRTCPRCAASAQSFKPSCTA
jgi:hypothetical protein